MELQRSLGLNPEQAAAALGAARRVVEADAVGPASARLMEVAARALGLDGDWRDGAAPSDAALSHAFLEPRQREALAAALLIPACIEGEVTQAREDAARAIARALGVDTHWVRLLPALRRRSTFAVKRALMSRSPDGRRIMKRTWEEEGVWGLLKAVWFVLGFFTDAALAARYRALKELPVGTLGRAFHDHLASRGLSLPGERGGLPERMIHHDLMHVVNGYDTDPAGECELGGFYCGFADGDAFTFIVTVLTTFHLGMAVSPAVVTPARGAFDPERVLQGFLRGRRLKLDVMGPWDPFTLYPLALPEARARLGIGEAPA